MISLIALTLLAGGAASAAAAVSAVKSADPWILAPTILAAAAGFGSAAIAARPRKPGVEPGRVAEGPADARGAAAREPTETPEAAESREEEEPKPAEPVEAADDSTALALVKLRFADAICSKVPIETEAAAFSLMERLAAIRAEAERAARDAATTQGEDLTGDTVSKLAGNAQATIGEVRKALEAMRLHDKSAAAGLRSLGDELSSAIGLLDEIGEITERSRLIAFNMSIEAARIGSRGNGFKVIVGELRKLNDQTAEFSKRVSELLSRFKKFNESLVRNTVDESDKVSEEVERGIEAEENAVRSLMRVSHACVDLTAGIERVVESTNEDLDRILESLQFQDITRQMVEGAQAILAEVQEDLRGRLGTRSGGHDQVPDAARVEALRSKFLLGSHTRGEKEAIQEVVV